jgi:hypothetical protein
VNANRTFTSTQANAATIISAASAWDSFPHDLKPSLKIPLERLNRGLAAASSVDCAIDVGLALEALLLGDLGPNDQLSLAFRLRGAWLLGANPSERKALWQDFRNIYDCRSSAVHKGKLPSGEYQVESGKVSADEFIRTRGRSVAANAVLKVIEGGASPDWAALILGAHS